MQQLVVKNGVVIATHAVDQDLNGKYPDCEVFCYDGALRPGKGTDLTPDPRLRDDPMVVARRPRGGFCMTDEEGNWHEITVDRDSILRVRKLEEKR